MGGKSEESESTQTSAPWAAIQPYLKDVFGQAQDLNQQGMSYFPGQTYAGFDPLQTQGQQGVLDYASQYPGMLAPYQQASQQMLNAPDVANNPYISGMADTIESRLNRNLQENLIPGVTQNALMAGQPSGSRAGVAEGIATRGTQEAIGSSLSDLYGGAYGQGLTAQTNALSMSPQMLQMGMVPSQIQQQVGAQRQGMEQSGIDEAVNRQQYNQNAPWDALSRYNALLSGGLPFGTATTNSTQSGGGGLFGDLLGAGMSVAGLMTGNPMMAMGGLGSMFSSPAPVGTAGSFGYGSVPGFG